jgi:HPt (histidine-containing phosphotransfer) domain-containing protein
MRSVSREELADALWPAGLPHSWAAALRSVVTEVRRFLELGGLDPNEMLVTERGGYRLHLPVGVTVDVDEVREAQTQAQAALAAGDATDAAADADRAARLSGLPFLPHHEGDWVDSVRDELRAAHVAARMPIMALSANVMQDEPERCRAVGMDDFAAKPATIPFLAGKLQQWLPHLSWPQDESTDRPAAVATSATTDGIFDPAVLEDLTAGDSALIATLLDDFIGTTRTDLVSLDAAIAARDAEEARRRAHRLKGASRIVGAHRLSGLAQQIEDTAADSSDCWTTVEALAGELRATFSGAVPPRHETSGPGQAHDARSEQARTCARRHYDSIRRECRAGSGQRTLPPNTLTGGSRPRNTR